MVHGWAHNSKLTNQIQRRVIPSFSLERFEKSLSFLLDSKVELIMGLELLALILPPHEPETASNTEVIRTELAKRSGPLFGVLDPAIPEVSYI